jgi:predicted secreted protein
MKGNVKMRPEAINRKNITRLTVAVIIILGLLAAFVHSDDSYAAKNVKTTTITLYKGQTFNNVIEPPAVDRSATLKSSKKSVLAVKKKRVNVGKGMKNYATWFTITAKKTGSATLTLKYKRLDDKKNITRKFVVTVKNWPKGSIRQPITLQSDGNVTLESMDHKKQLNLGLTVYKGEDAKDITLQICPENVLGEGFADVYDTQKTDYPNRSFYLLKYDYNVIKGFSGGKYAYLQSPVGGLYKGPFKRIEQGDDSPYDESHEYNAVEGIDNNKFYVYYMRDKNFRYENGAKGTFYVGLFMDNDVKNFYGYNVLSTYNIQRVYSWNDFPDKNYLDGCIKTVLP